MPNVLCRSAWVSHKSGVSVCETSIQLVLRSSLSILLVMPYVLYRFAWVSHEFEVLVQRTNIQLLLVGSELLLFCWWF